MYYVHQGEISMRKRIPVSEARARLSRLLKALQSDPELVVEITINGIVAGELRAPGSE